MNIGYSFWGFLGEGITDTPDGGRGHRYAWLRELARQGHTIVNLQQDRDATEAHDLSFQAFFEWDCASTPSIDLLFLEWRWPIPGRNVGIACGEPGHTCDLHRQDELLKSYTYRRGTPTLIWDKDLRLPLNSPIRRLPNVQVAETAWRPRVGSFRLQIPVSQDALTQARYRAKEERPEDRDISLLYVGNQYERDDRFNEYFAIPALTTPHHYVVGKWTQTSNWPWVTFQGRRAFRESMQFYERALATVALLPPRYEKVGQTTQRVAEAVTRGCVALVPRSVASADRITPPELLVSRGAAVNERIAKIRAMPVLDYQDLRLRAIDLLEPLQTAVQYQNLVENCRWFSDG
ncbi:MAG: hypothetical protein QM582_11040 [Micropruina sp.]|uniref:hypothetical protein n=1 Tax=Micropruina sp. TaxID=2737536 RepID=UPI0039E6832F